MAMRHPAPLTPLILFGLLTLGAGGTSDIAYHAMAPGHHSGQEAAAAVSRNAEALFGADGQRAHLVTLAGMVLTLGGVVSRGITRSGSGDGGGGSEASSSRERLGARQP